MQMVGSPAPTDLLDAGSPQTPACQNAGVRSTVRRGRPVLCGDGGCCLSPRAHSCVWCIGVRREGGSAGGAGVETEVTCFILF